MPPCYSLPLFCGRDCSAAPRPRRSSGIQRPQPRYDLFYNYYAGQYGGQPAQLYISPRPTPPFVGHTYMTYQPLMPHEFLYKHHRFYHRYNVYDCGATKTCVCWW